MHELRWLNPLALSLVMGGCMIGVPVEAPPATPRPVAPSTRNEPAIVAELINSHRRKVGCRPLVWTGAVASVAQRHSEDMAYSGYFSHTNMQGESPFDRLRKAGITYRMAAENIAEGQPTAEAVLASWLSSRGHRSNIENCNFTQHGVGMHRNRWTHVFVTLR